MKSKKIKLKPGKWYTCENANIIPCETQEESREEALSLSRKARWLHFYSAKEDPSWIMPGVPFLVLMSGKVSKTFNVVTSKGPSGWICPDYRLLMFKIFA